MQAKALIKERAQRNLLLVIDGQKSEEMLLANLAGITPGDFTALEAMGLIEPAAQRSSSRPGAPSEERAAAPAAPATAAPAVPPEPIDYAQFTKTLTQLISKELGLRGFTLSLAVEKAGTTEELIGVANRVLQQIGERKGAPAAEAARRSLYGS